MKLYSRGQVVFFIISAAAIIIFLFTGFNFFRNISEPDKNLVDTESDNNNGSETSSFQIQTNSIPVEDVIHANSDGSGFSADELENIGIYERLNKCVVNITTEVLGYNWFNDPVAYEGGTGSGSIIDTRGYILTNYHVVEKTYKVYVTLYNGDLYEGEVIGKDIENDLAVIKINPEETELITIPFGYSAELKVGQKVLAIGNPFGYDRTLTTGIVSGLGRPVRNNNGILIQDMIQTDASINPGNSGGPLINSRGQMIGINTMIYSPSGGSVGIGFASPVDTARRIVPELIEFGTVIRGWIDIISIPLIPKIAAYGKISVEKGILITELVKDGNADIAGLKGGNLSNPVRYGNSYIYFGGDVIIGINNHDVHDSADLLSALEDTKPGEVVSVNVIRGRAELTFEVTLSQRPESSERN